MQINLGLDANVANEPAGLLAIINYSDNRATNDVAITLVGYEAGQAFQSGDRGKLEASQCFTANYPSEKHFLGTPGHSVCRRRHYPQSIHD
jgi:hypothetical protein